MAVAGRTTRWLSRALELARSWTPLGVRQRLWEERTLAAVPGATTRDVDRLFARVAPTIDRARLRRLHAAHRAAPPDLEEACDHERKLRIAIVKAMLRGLHVTTGRRVLDIGHGGGYFVVVCRRLGHDCDGTEVPVARLPRPAASLYAELTAALGIHDQHRLRIEPHRPIALPRAYDLICAHKICFNDHRRATEWGVDEWRFFVEDVRRHLAPGGRVVLELNEHVERYGRLRWYDRPLRAYFASVGMVDGSWITIPA